MNSKRSVILVLCFLSLCFISACRTTESRIQSLSPDLLNGSSLNDNKIQASGARTSGSNMKFRWVLLAALALGGAIMMFTSDRTPEKKQTPSRRKPSTKRRKK